MDIHYVTKRVIVLLATENENQAAYRQYIKETILKLQSNHERNYMIFNLSEKRNDLDKLSANIFEYAWPIGHAPTLERLFGLTNEINNWLRQCVHHVVVLHSKGDRGRTGLALAAFVSYIEKNNETDANGFELFALRRFFEDRLLGHMSPSQKRYMQYFQNVLSGRDKLNQQHHFLHQVSIIGLPDLDNNGSRIVMKIYENMCPIYVSPVYYCHTSNNNSTNARRIRMPIKNRLRLNGDIILKIYQKRHKNAQHQLMFKVQFNTSTINSPWIVFGTNEIDYLTHDKTQMIRKIELRLSTNGSINESLLDVDINGEERCTYDVIDTSGDGLIAANSYENFNAIAEDKLDPQLEILSRQLHEPGYKHGPVDGNLYATINKPHGQGQIYHDRHLTMADDDQRPAHVSLDSGISSPTVIGVKSCDDYEQRNGDYGTKVASEIDRKTLSPEIRGEIFAVKATSNEVFNRKPVSPEVTNGVRSPPPAAAAKKPLNDREQAELDELLDCLMTEIEKIPDIETVERRSHANRSRQTSPTSPIANQPPIFTSSTPKIHSNRAYTDSRSQLADDISIIDDETSTQRVDSPTPTLPTDHFGRIEPLPPKFLTRPTRYEADERNLPYHGRTGSRPFTYGVTAGSPAIQRRRLHSESTAYISESQPRPVPNGKRQPISAPNSPPISRTHIDESDSDVFSVSTLYDDNLTWLQRQQMKLRQKQQAENRPRQRQERQLMDELRGTVKRNNYTGGDYSSRECSPISQSVDESIADSRVERTPPIRTSSRGILQTMQPNNSIANVERQSSRDQQERQPQGDCVDGEIKRRQDTTEEKIRPYKASQFRSTCRTQGQMSPSWSSSVISNASPNESPRIQSPSTDDWPSQFRVGNQSPMTYQRILSNQSSEAGVDSPSIYFGQSQRSSLLSLNDSEIISQHPIFVKDTSKFWYKPNISRDDAIKILRVLPPGYFIIRDSNSFIGSFGLAMKVPQAPVNGTKTGDSLTDSVRHFLIEPTSKGVRLKGYPNEPVFGSLPAFVYQHSITPMSLACKLIIPESDIEYGINAGESRSMKTSHVIEQERKKAELLHQGAACNVSYLGSIGTESLTGPQAITKSVTEFLDYKTNVKPIMVNFRVANSGITLTDNSHKLFFRRHYPPNSISYCGIDPQNRFYQSQDTPAKSQIFGFVARKSTINHDNLCHLFAEYEPQQPASQIVQFVNQVLPQTGSI